jgi:hypothetical protein
MIGIIQRPKRRCFVLHCGTHRGLRHWMQHGSKPEAGL